MVGGKWARSLQKCRALLGGAWAASALVFLQHLLELAPLVFGEDLFDLALLSLRTVR